MKKFIILTLVAVLVMPLFTHAQEEDTYHDADGLYTMPIPTNWTVSENGAVVTVSDPEGAIQVYVVVVDGTDAESAIASAWQQARPDFTLTAADTQSYTDPAITSGADAIWVLTYGDPNNADYIAQGVGVVFGGKTYIQLFEGSITAFQQRSSQVNLIATGFKITAMQEVNLAEVEPQPLSEALLSDLETYITAEMAKFNVPGAEVAIVKGDEVVYSQGFGVRNGDSAETVTPDTRMMIGSTTKTMTTMLMGILVDEGKMQWDTPVVSVYPEFAVADPDITQKMTMMNLVCACTGVPRRDLELLFNSNDLTAEDVVASLSTFEFFTDFGEAFQYSNQMVATGGYMATLAAGGKIGQLNSDYINLMEQNVFAPIGMTNTTFDFDEVRNSGNYAVPFVANLLGEYTPAPIDIEDWTDGIAPAGGVWSTANDMAKYLITEINQGVAPDGTQVISADNLAYTWQPQVPIDAQTSYGLGWMIQNYKGVHILSHDGVTLGFTSGMSFLPDEGIGIVVLSNQTSSGFNGAVIHRFLELLYQQEPEYEAQMDLLLDVSADAVTELQSRIVPIDPAVLPQLEGTFTNDALGGITLSMVDDKLILDTGDFQTEIIAVKNDEGKVSYLFFETILAGLQLTPSEDGQTLTLGAGVNEYIFTRVN